MAQPPEYNRSKNFVSEIANETAGASLNTEFNNIASSVNTIRDNLGAIQKDDATLANGIVKADNLDATLLEGIKAEVVARITGEALGNIVQQYIADNGIDLQEEIQKALEDVGSDVAVINNESASDNTVYSSNKVEQLLGGYLPLSGNKEITGKVTVNGIVSKDNGGTPFVKNSANGSQYGFTMYTFPANNTTYKGGFINRCFNTSGGYKELTGNSDGVLSWNGGTVNFNSANVSASTLTTSGSMTCNGKLTANNFSPITLQFPRVSTVTETTGADKKGLLISANGSYAAKDSGGGINLKALDATVAPGGWELLSRTNALTHTLRGLSSGELQYTGTSIKFMGVNANIKNNDKKHAFSIYSGTTENDSPSLVMYGNEASSNAGTCVLNAGKFLINTGDGKYKLSGDKDGNLTWGTKTSGNEKLLHVAKSSDITVDNTGSATTNSGYVTLVNGLTFAWGSAFPNASSGTVNFPCTFTAVHTVIANRWDTSSTDTSGVGTALLASNVTKTSFRISLPSDSGCKWMAIGYIKQG